MEKYNGVLRQNIGISIVKTRVRIMCCCCCCVHWPTSVTLRCSSSLNYMDEYLAINSGEYLSTASLRIYCNVAESYQMRGAGVRRTRYVRAWNVGNKMTGKSDRK